MKALVMFALGVFVFPSPVLASDAVYQLRAAVDERKPQKIKRPAFLPQDAYSYSDMLLADVQVDDHPRAPASWTVPNREGGGHTFMRYHRWFLDQRIVRHWRGYRPSECWVNTLPDLSIKTGSLWKPPHSIAFISEETDAPYGWIVFDGTDASGRARYRVWFIRQ